MHLNYSAKEKSNYLSVQQFKKKYQIHEDTEKNQFN